MLRPRRHPLIDGRLTVSTLGQVRRWQLACLALVLVVVGLVAAWPSPGGEGSEVSDEVWWRRLISSVVLKRLGQDVDASALGELRQRVAQLEAERIALTERLAEADKLIKTDVSAQRLGKVVARRDGRDISFEILLRNPGGESEQVALSVDVMAIRTPAGGASIARAGTLPIEVDRATRLAVKSPRVAETFQGRLPSAASHLLVMVTPVDGAERAEAVVVPVSGKP